MNTTTMNETNTALTREIALLIERARIMSEDIGDNVEDVFEGVDVPKLSVGEAATLLDRVVAVVRERQRKLGQTPIAEQHYEALMSQVQAARAAVGAIEVASNTKKAPFLTYNGIAVHPVKPAAVFHRREVALNEGYVRTRDLDLWDSNERIEIHLQQFQRINGRKPKPGELLEIMFSRLKLEGITEADQFQIPALANSIATNGLRKPPILSIDGRLLDGNRRLAACYYILMHDEFTVEQKKRVDYILVWQLTEHSTPDDEEAVIVSLNFEDDHKQKWPEYVKARKVYDEYEAAVQLEGGRATPERRREIRREISQKFALGFDTSIVTRYIKMVETARDFEAHHIVDRQRDRFAVQHKTSEKFQYFDELSKGTGPGGVAHQLGLSDSLKGAVYELLYADKFRNWKQIRDLRTAADSDEAIELLHRAANTQVNSDDDLMRAQEQVEDALAVGRVKRAEQRAVGADTRIESFVAFLEDLSPKAIMKIKPENLKRLRMALNMVDGMIERQGQLFEPESDDQ